MIIQDPDGTGLPDDAGRTVAGPDDSRLSEIDVVPVSHMHGDHVGDRRLPEVNAGSCGKPDASILTLPNGNSVDAALDLPCSVRDSTGT